MVASARERRLAPLLCIALLSACAPDLSAWRVVPSGVDGGPDPMVDSGMGQPNPPDLGSPCPNPYVAAVTVGSTSEDARILRLDARTGEPCRDAPLISTQPDWGYAIYDVDWGAGTGEVLGIQDAVMALGEDGFPAWRNEPPEMGFDGSWVVSLGGPQNRIAAMWAERSSSNLEYMRLFDAEGGTLGGVIELPFFSAMVAAHPDGSGQLIWASRAGEIRAVPVSEALTSIGDEDGVELFAGSADLRDAFGTRNHLDADIEGRRLAMTHEMGVAIWTVGGPAPASVITCPSHCASYQIAVPDPDSASAAIILCTRDGERHLVHATSSGCERWVDGTSLGSRSLQDITLVRAAL
jgi:hypothetical protein